MTQLSPVVPAFLILPQKRMIYPKAIIRSDPFEQIRFWYSIVSQNDTDLDSLVGHPITINEQSCYVMSHVDNQQLSPDEEFYIRHDTGFARHNGPSILAPNEVFQKLEIAVSLATIASLVNRATEVPFPTTITWTIPDERSRYFCQIEHVTHPNDASVGYRIQYWDTKFGKRWHTKEETFIHVRQVGLLPKSMRRLIHSVITMSNFAMIRDYIEKAKGVLAAQLKVKPDQLIELETQYEAT